MKWNGCKYWRTNRIYLQCICIVVCANDGLWWIHNITMKSMNRISTVRSVYLCSIQLICTLEFISIYIRKCFYLFYFNNETIPMSYYMLKYRIKHRLRWLLSGTVAVWIVSLCFALLLDVGENCVPKWQTKLTHHSWHNISDDDNNNSYHNNNNNNNA